MAPCACFAILPVSNVSFRPPSSRLFCSTMFLTSCSPRSPGNLFEIDGNTLGNCLKKKERQTNAQCAETTPRIAPCNSDLCGEKKLRPDWPFREWMLLAQAKTFDNLAIPIWVAAVQVVQQAATAIDHHDQTAPRSVIFCVGFEVSGKVVDALAQQRNLHFR